MCIRDRLHDIGAPIDLDWISDNRFVMLSETGILGGSAKVTIGEVSGRFPATSGAVSGGASVTVSYTHLDVYKRQPLTRPSRISVGTA